MARVVVISWDRPGADERSSPLREGGHEIQVLTPGGMPELRAPADAPPDVVVRFARRA